ncbi:MAG: aconitate hydratase, partial [Desulfobacteraceae bacterium]|nr:aconitate hydratase [Desulfobacteraceae bacterium]
MPKTITQKILDDHLASHGKECAQGEEVGIWIDQTLMHDATGTMGFQAFEALGIQQVRTSLSVNYADHNTVQMGPENADDHRYIQTIAGKCGVVFSRAGNGICHQV